jgi:hypothetical protein
MRLKRNGVKDDDIRTNGSDCMSSADVKQQWKGVTANIFLF